MVFLGIHNFPSRVSRSGYAVRQTPTGGWSASSPASTVGPHRDSWSNFYSGLYGGVSYINQAVGGGGLGDVARSTYDPYFNQSQNLSYMPTTQSTGYSNSSFPSYSSNNANLGGYSVNNLFSNSYYSPNRVSRSGYAVRQTPTGGWSASSPASTVGPHRDSWSNFYSGLYGGVSYINQAVGGGGLGDVARESWQGISSPSLYGAAGIVGYNQVNSTPLNPNGGLNFNVQNHFASVNPYSVPSFHNHGAFSGLYS